jgi:hypothetical protein
MFKEMEEVIKFSIQQLAALFCSGGITHSLVFQGLSLFF